MSKPIKIAMWVVLGILLVALFGFLIMGLWNWLMPKIFGLPVLTYFEALGLFLLAKIIFGFGGKGGGRDSDKNWQWKYRLFNKFEHMSPEERERFKEKLKDKWCRWEEKKTNTENPAEAGRSTNL